eukprot:3616534-Rhodomonas_salina.1
MGGATKAREGQQRGEGGRTQGQERADFVGEVARGASGEEEAGCERGCWLGCPCRCLPAEPWRASTCPPAGRSSRRSTP